MSRCSTFGFPEGFNKESYTIFLRKLRVFRVGSKIMAWIWKQVTNLKQDKCVIFESSNGPHNDIYGGLKYL